MLSLWVCTARSGKRVFGNVTKNAVIDYLKMVGQIT